MMNTTMDHPRVCGEQPSNSSSMSSTRGSPPRVRGTVLEPRLRARKIRITPACAGNSFYCVSPHIHIGDHPRVCGEQVHRSASVTGFPGSPPRVRGTASSVSETASSGRITPACAGNSRRIPAPAMQTWDHPRVCGEQLLYTLQSRRPTGSPPRVRGTV